MAGHYYTNDKKANDWSICANPPHINTPRALTSHAHRHTQSLERILMHPFPFKICIGYNTLISNVSGYDSSSILLEAAVGLTPRAAWGCRPDKGALALLRRPLLSWLLSLQLTADLGCSLQRYDSGRCAGYLSWLLRPRFHPSHPCRGGMGTIMRQTLPSWISVHKKPRHKIYLFLVCFVLFLIWLSNLL